MQRQKVIAKCLAVVLAMTVAVACYLVFGSIGKSAAGSASNTTTAGNVAPEPEEPHIPIYSTLPRAAETVNGRTIAHTGGEGREALLDACYVDGKWLVIFKTDSAEYDVKGGGLYIASLLGGTLEKTELISDDDSYVCALLTSGGYLVVSKTSDKTILRLYDKNLNVTAISELEAYEDYKFLTGEDGDLAAYVYDGRYIRRLSLSKSLEAKTDNFVFPASLTRFEYAISLDIDILFLDSESGAQIVTYSQNDGFNIKDSVDKARFLQVIPHSSDERQTFVTLLESEDGFEISLYSDALKLLARKSYQGGAGYVRTVGSDIELTVDTKAYTFCSHLQLESERDIAFGLGENVKYTSVAGSDILYGISEGKLCVMRYTEDITEIFTTECSYGLAAKAADTLCIFFDGTYADMAFGGVDIFFISMLT